MQRHVNQQCETSSRRSEEKQRFCADAIHPHMSVAMDGYGGLRNKRLKEFNTRVLFTFNSHIQLHYDISSQSICIHLQQLIKKNENTNKLSTFNLHGTMIIETVVVKAGSAVPCLLYGTNAKQVIWKIPLEPTCRSPHPTHSTFYLKQP